MSKRKTLMRQTGAFGSSLCIERYTNGPYLESDGPFIWKLTPSRVRKMIAALTPYADWTPDLYGKAKGEPTK